MHKHAAKQGWNLGFSSQMTVLSSDHSVLSNRCLQPQPPLPRRECCHRWQFWNKGNKSSSAVEKTHWFAHLPPWKALLAEVRVEGSHYSLRPRTSRGYGCVLLTSLYSFLVVPLAVVNLCPTQLSAARPWQSRRTWQVLCPDCHVNSSRTMLRPGLRSALGPLAVVGSKLARAAEAGISASPWPKPEGPWDAIHGPPALGFPSYISEAHIHGRTSYMTGRVREDWQLLNK